MRPQSGARLVNRSYDPHGLLVALIGREVRLSVASGDELSQIACDTFF